MRLLRLLAVISALAAAVGWALASIPQDNRLLMSPATDGSYVAVFSCQDSQPVSDPTQPISSLCWVNCANPACISFSFGELPGPTMDQGRNVSFAMAVNDMSFALLYVTNSGLFLTRCNNMSCFDSSTTQVRATSTLESRFLMGTSIAYSLTSLPVFAFIMGNPTTGLYQSILAICDDQLCSAWQEQIIEEWFSGLENSSAPIFVKPDIYGSYVVGYQVATTDNVSLHLWRCDPSLNCDSQEEMELTQEIATIRTTPVWAPSSQVSVLLGGRRVYMFHYTSGPSYVPTPSPPSGTTKSNLEQFDESSTSEPNTLNGAASSSGDTSITPLESSAPENSSIEREQTPENGQQANRRKAGAVDANRDVQASDSTIASNWSSSALSLLLQAPAGAIGYQTGLTSVNGLPFIPLSYVAYGTSQVVKGYCITAACSEFTPEELHTVDLNVPVGVSADALSIAHLDVVTTGPSDSITMFIHQPGGTITVALFYASSVTDPAVANLALTTPTQIVPIAVPVGAMSIIGVANALIGCLLITFCVVCFAIHFSNRRNLDETVVRDAFMLTTKQRSMLNTYYLALKPM